MIGNIITFLLLGAFFWWLIPADASPWTRIALIVIMFGLAYGKIKMKAKDTRVVYVDGKQHTIYEPGSDDKKTKTTPLPPAE